MKIARRVIDDVTATSLDAVAPCISRNEFIIFSYLLKNYFFEIFDNIYDIYNFAQFFLLIDGEQR